MAVQELAFRRLAAGDLPLLQAWLAAEPALRWYAQGRAPTMEGMESKYLPRIRGEVPVSCWILLRAGRPAGYFQAYLARDFPHDFHNQPAVHDPGAAALDYLLAPEVVGQGLAAPALRVFLQEVVFSWPDVRICYADPDPANLASVRALRRAGFSSVPLPAPLPNVLLLACPRPPQS